MQEAQEAIYPAHFLGSVSDVRLVGLRFASVFLFGNLLLVGFSGKP